MTLPEDTTVGETLEEPLLVQVDEEPLFDTHDENAELGEEVPEVPRTNRRSCFCHPCMICCYLLLFIMFGPIGLFFPFPRGFGSCMGTEACLNNTGRIAFGSCNGDQACQNNQGPVGSGACNGDQACVGNEGSVASMSCNGDGSCQSASPNSTIAKGSCNGDNSCFANTACIQAGSCNGDAACYHNHRDIDAGTCNGDKSCCDDASAASVEAERDE